MVKLKYNLHRFLDVLIFLSIIGLSIIIFIFKDELQNINEIGYIGIIILCFFANATVLLPSPSLMIAVSCALIMKPMIVALCSAFGSTLGELVGYVFGTVTKKLSPKFQEIIDKFSTKIHNKAILVFVLALLPLPFFDIVGIYSGGSKMNLIKFFLACFLGKFIKILIYIKIYDIFKFVSSIIPGLGGLIK